MRRDRLTVTALALAGIGIVLAAYLSYVHARGLASACGLGGNCEKVQSSVYSKVGGIPVAYLGLAGYIVLCLTLPLRHETAELAATATALIGFGFSAYLTYRELFTLHAICPWCVGSAVLMTALAVLTTARLLGPVSRGSHATSWTGRASPEQ